MSSKFRRPRSQPIDADVSDESVDSWEVEAMGEKERKGKEGKSRGREASEATPAPRTVGLVFAAETSRFKAYSFSLPPPSSSGRSAAAAAVPPPTLRATWRYAPSDFSRWAATATAEAKADSATTTTTSTSAAKGKENALGVGVDDMLFLFHSQGTAYYLASHSLALSTTGPQTHGWKKAWTATARPTKGPESSSGAYGGRIVAHAIPSALAPDASVGVKAEPKEESNEDPGPSESHEGSASSSFASSAKILLANRSPFVSLQGANRNRDVFAATSRGEVFVGSLTLAEDSDNGVPGLLRWVPTGGPSDDDSEAVVATWSLSRPVHRIRLSGKGSDAPVETGPGSWMAVVGAPETLTTVWDITRQKEIWKAKNVPLDSLNMDVPIWDKDALWLSQGRLLATSTAYGQVRVYDVRSRNRLPVLDYDLLQTLRLQRGESKVQQLTQQEALVLNNLRLNPYAGDGRGTVLCASSHEGHLFMLDLRRNWAVSGKASATDPTQQPQVLSRLKGFAGSIRDVQFHPSEPIVAAVGLDRYLRVYSAKAPFGLLSATYAKLRLTRIVWSELDTPEAETSVAVKKEDQDVPQATANEDEPQDVDDEEEEDMWAEMEVVGAREAKPKGPEAPAAPKNPKKRKLASPKTKNPAKRVKQL